MHPSSSSQRSYARTRLPALAVVQSSPGDGLLDRALTRAAGAPLIGGNQVRVLQDGADHYSAWLGAIRTAKRTIFFESYIIHEDESGAEFADALAERARAGVQVRLIYDWVGALGKTSRRFWRRLSAAGVEVRCFNPPRLGSPFGWVNRDHRKMLAVDGRIGFVTGLCIGRMWMGDPARGVEGWRDTGVEVHGPAVADIERAFAQVWATIGDPIPESELHQRSAIAAVGDTALRIVASAPGRTGVLRVDQLIASAARQTLWLADAYFAGMPSYVQALRAAALDGVDVRLLVPGVSDLPWLRPLSRFGYRPLLEAGVRVYEWNGPMMHAKTAVADGRWARVGSSNLNIASWIGNYELDVVVEDERFAETMERMFLADLGHATELVLESGRRRRGTPAEGPEPIAEQGRRTAKAGRSTGSASRAAAGALRIGHTVKAAIGNQRILAPATGWIAAMLGVVLLAAAALAVRWPLLVALPTALLTGWVGIALLARAYELRRERRARAQAHPGEPVPLVEQKEGDPR
jgi:cardiolipin synthase